MIGVDYHSIRFWRLDLSLARAPAGCMKTIGDKFPAFTATAVAADKQFTQLTDQTYPGKWKIYFFWPKDFTFVCPTEIAAFGKLENEFRARDAQLLGASIDNEFVHLAW